MKLVTLTVMLLLVSEATAAAETQLARGAYLVDAVAACASCHTPRAPAGPALSGGNTFGSGEAAVVAPNITPDRETGIGTWSDAQIVSAIREDVRPDGSSIRSPMPQRAFRAISDADCAAIVAYLRSLPPIRHAVGTPATNASVPHKTPVGSVPMPVTDTPLDTGRYLANGPAHCSECHALKSAGPGAPVPRVFKGPWGSVVAPPLTSETLRRYTDADLAKIVMKGTRPDGTKLVGPMPVRAYAGLMAEDMAAITTYLRR